MSFDPALLAIWVVLGGFLGVVGVGVIMLWLRVRDIEEALGQAAELREMQAQVKAASDPRFRTLGDTE